jgi:hypothetical protein
MKSMSNFEKLKNETKTKILDIFDSLRFDERPLHCTDFCDFTKEMLTIEKFKEAVKGGVHGDRSKFDLKYISKNPEWNISTAITLQNPQNFIEDYLEKERTSVISNWNLQDNLSTLLMNLILEQCKQNIDVNGVWPARMTSNNSGYLHAYVAKKGAPDITPRATVHHNFILQCEGKSEVIVYSNRSFGLRETEFYDAYTTSEQVQDFYKNTLEVQKVIEVNEGDLVYIPARQFFCIENIDDNARLHMPYVLKTVQEW